MKEPQSAAGTAFHYRWKDGGTPRSFPGRFTAAVSLHGHTWNSHESLAFLPNAVQKMYFLPVLLKWAEGRYERKWKSSFDYAQGYWTSPVSSDAAYSLEARQIENLGLKPFVSLTDHDSIDAAAELPGCPVSLEWTAPYKGAVFHIGVHNLPAKEAPTIVEQLRAYTDRPEHEKLGGILAELAALPDSLIVFNHPLSDQGRIGFEIHESRVREFLEKHRASFHALEANAMQPWDMNRRVAAMAARAELPVIAGGDRHGFEPNGAINLTNARTFAEFAREVREEKRSDVLFMRQMRRSLKLRYAENVKTIMDEYPLLSGREYWYDRVFYRCPDGVMRSFAELVGHSYALNAMNFAVDALGIANLAFRPITPVFAEEVRRMAE